MQTLVQYPRACKTVEHKFTYTQLKQFMPCLNLTQTTVYFPNHMIINQEHTST